MINNMVSLDFYGSHFYIKFEGKEYHWDDPAKFITDTGYPYTSTRLLAYEPERNMYLVERLGPESLSGQELPEIQWFTDNKQRLIPMLEQLIQADIPVVTMEMTRSQLLYDTDWIVQRHQEQLALGSATTLTPEQYIAVLNYKQQLRDLTNTYSINTPTEQVVWPTNPLN